MPLMVVIASFRHRNYRNYSFRETKSNNRRKKEGQSVSTKFVLSGRFAEDSIEEIQSIGAGAGGNAYLLPLALGWTACRSQYGSGGHEGSQRCK